MATIDTMFDGELSYDDAGNAHIENVEILIDLEGGDVPKTITLNNGAVFEVIESEDVSTGGRPVYTLGKYIKNEGEI